MLQGAKGAFPERGLGRAKTLPDACRAQRDSGVTRRVTRFLNLARRAASCGAERSGAARPTFMQYRNRHRYLSRRNGLRL